MLYSQSNSQPNRRNYKDRYPIDSKVSQNKGLFKMPLVMGAALLIGSLVGCGDKPPSEPVNEPTVEATSLDTTDTETPVAEPLPDSAGNSTTPDETIIEKSDASVEEAVAEEKSVEETVVENVTTEPAAETAPEPAAETTPEPALSADAGQDLYKEKCHVCHANGLLDAPKLGDKAAWAPRIAKGKDTLHKHSAKGFKKMPPQAINGVTEAQVHAAVDYMIAESS